MGRIKTTLIKRTSHQLVRDHRADFKKTFDENKEIVLKYADIPNKRLRNSVTGYVTRLVKRKE